MIMTDGDDNNNDKKSTDIDEEATNINEDQ
jgi:hypothetical protein